MSPKTKTSKKTLLAIAMALFPWGLQQLLVAEYYAGGIALAIGAVCIYAYEELQIKQIPTSARDLKDLSAELGDAVEQRVESSNDSQ